MKSLLVLLPLLFGSLSTELYGDAATDKLKALVDKLRIEGVAPGDVKALRDQIKSEHPGTEQAAMADSAYMSYLADVVEPSPLQEMVSIFQSLRSLGESKAYVVAARMSLISAYSQELKRAEAKALAQEGLQLIDQVSLTQSYNAIKNTLQFCCGAESVPDAEVRIGEWMTTLQEVANW